VSNSSFTCIQFSPFERRLMRTVD